MKQFFQSLREQDIRNVLALIIIVGTFVIQIMILKSNIPEKNHDIAIATVAMTLGMQAGVIAYYFGASKTDRKQGNTPSI